ncbi:nucleotidyltransferase domain-containing protein [Staphylothermus hellenicus]|uniref:DNA polymerase beta domain protein region n=1 Tax=Staphylothermus hellenicus (strain DSM 12710 / JCM 10830 / BK20S6-10-b1 / P8) TaxID=591019 RepID=D7DAI2_STAHD|nr:nucleotidyltransferase domain-containing protein [Staphylothermus hellenicus]ADI31179.1 DNA polymerase beta domain protein region [Staphylothermus hellenicus DSM 12710]
MVVEENKLLERAVNRLVKILNVKGIILFGSRARGDWMPWSDYDILIIADFKEKYLDRIKTVLDIIGDIPLNIEPHPYTLREALDMLRKGNPLIVDALEEGKILYATNDLEEIIKEYEKLKKKGLKRTNTTILIPK